MGNRLTGRLTVPPIPCSPDHLASILRFDAVCSLRLPSYPLLSVRLINRLAGHLTAPPIPLLPGPFGLHPSARCRLHAAFVAPVNHVTAAPGPADNRLTGPLTVPPISYSPDWLTSNPRVPGGQQIAESSLAGYGFRFALPFLLRSRPLCSPGYGIPFSSKENRSTRVCRRNVY